MKRLLIISTMLLIAIIPLYNYFEQNKDWQENAKQCNKFSFASQVKNEEILIRLTAEEITNEPGGEFNTKMITGKENQNIPLPADQPQNAAIPKATPAEKIILLNNPASINMPVTTPAAIIPVNVQDELTPEPETQLESVDSAVLQNEMLQFINAEREKAKLTLLTLDKSLCGGANLKSSDFVVNNYFSHTSPIYGSPFEMMTSQGISYRAAAENIAKNISVKEAHIAFMNSARHKANILNPEYSKAGLGFYQKGQYLYVTQWFTD